MVGLFSSIPLMSGFPWAPPSISCGSSPCSPCKLLTAHGLTVQVYIAVVFFACWSQTDGVPGRPLQNKDNCSLLDASRLRGRFSQGSQWVPAAAPQTDTCCTPNPLACHRDAMRRSKFRSATLRKLPSGRHRGACLAAICGSKRQPPAVSPPARPTPFLQWTPW